MKTIAISHYLGPWVLSFQWYPETFVKDRNSSASLSGYLAVLIDQHFNLSPWKAIYIQLSDVTIKWNKSTPDLVSVFFFFLIIIYLFVYPTDSV